MPDIVLHEIKGVEIFAAGLWNGDKYTNEDIDGMIQAASEISVEVPLKKGHSRTVGERAYGWVKNLRRRGVKLIADFVDVPDDVFSWIKARLFNHVSVEVFYDYKFQGRVYSKVLAAVSLLGSERPAVSTLAPLRSVVHSQVPAKSIHSYSLPFRMESSMTDYNEYNLPPDQVAHLRVMKLIDAGVYKREEYALAANAVLAEDRELAAAYASFTSVRE